MNEATITYKAYRLRACNEQVEVFDPRFPERPVFKAPSLQKAGAWVDAYRKGQHWAVAERLP